MLQQLVSLLSESKQSLGVLAEKLSIQQHELNQLFAKLDQKGIVVQIDAEGFVKLPDNIYPLSTKIIESVLSTENADKVEIDCQLLIDSTNHQLLHFLPNPNKLCICSAEWQAKGRGRMERAWISPIGQNLLFSMARHWGKSDPIVEAGILEVLSLMAGVAVATTLKALDLDVVKLKWPNDIVVKNSEKQLEKIAGILVESKTDSREGTWVVGIGLNVTDVSSWHNQVDQRITSIAQLTSADYSREVILAGVIENWLNLEQELLIHGVEHIMQKWREFDVLFEEQITVQPTSGDSYPAIARGINEQGLLKVEPINTTENEILLHSGEVKVRLKDASIR